MEDMKGAEGRCSGVSSLPGSPANRQPRSKIEDLRISSSFKVANGQASARNVQHSKTSSVDSFYDLKEQKGFIDTAAPFESVRAAVSIFGGILDRKSNKVAAAEKSKNIQPDPESIEEDIQKYKKQLEVAEEAKTRALDELYITKRLIDELKHGLEKAEAEEAQAKQDSALAQLRVKEMEQGITADDASPAARAQVEVTKARHEAAVKELGAVREELAALRGDYDRLLTERDSAIARADEAVSACRDVERKVEALTLELIAMKEAIQSAHSLHLEAEEAKMVTAWARDQDVLNWEKELKRAEGEMQQLTEEVSSANDARSKFDTASSLLLGLRAELASYTEGEVARDVDGELVQGGDDEASKTQQASTPHGPALASAKKELQEVQSSTEKARDEVNCLKVAASSLKAELDREAEALAALRQGEGAAAGTVSSLEAELGRVQQDLDVVLAKEKEAKERTESLPVAIRQAAENAEQAKTEARAAREELEKAKEEAERAKADAGAVEARLLAAEKEIEAAKAAESLALGTVRAMEESERKQQRAAAAAASSGDGGAAADIVTLSVEEYQKLSKEARDAEDLANRKVISTIEQIKDAKKSELLSLERVEAAHKELEGKKAALSAAVEKEEKANEAKARAEQELRDWMAENERRDAASSPGLPPRSSSGRFEEAGEPKSAAKKEGSMHVKSMSEPVIFSSNEAAPEPEPEPKPKKKKSFFPRAVMFLARKKVQSLK